LIVVTCCAATYTRPECRMAATTESTAKVTNTVSSLRLLMVVLFDGANIAILCRFADSRMFPASSLLVRSFTLLPPCGLLPLRWRA